jgi:hypothetical protein
MQAARTVMLADIGVEADCGVEAEDIRGACSEEVCSRQQQGR